MADASGSYARARYVKVDVVTGPTVLEDLSYGLTDYWYYYPAITADAMGNSLMVFNRSGGSEFAGIRYTGTEAGTVYGSFPLKAGEGDYERLDGIGRNRWGDYSGIAVDPANPNNVWMFAEYATDNSIFWGTWWGEVSFAGPPDIDVSPTSFTFNLPVGGATSDILTISNTAPPGSNDLIWNITEQNVTVVLNDGGKLPVFIEAANSKTQTHSPTLQLRNPSRANVSINRPQAKMSGQGITSTGDLRGTASSDKILPPDDLFIPSSISVVNTLLIETNNLTNSVARALNELGVAYDFMSTWDFTTIDYTPYT
ncbi:MAG: hypothetical protein GWN00_04280, partial [Aliifodinibius sp.]|nr:hypothetical protein [Fodinibius sp.]NIX54834.1 hypothetical protein [candidate division Zixibacteria bacterium]NIY24048.1 hypothetical protein [Fodinibius sp.]